jgi:hypothetical protein
MKQRISSLPVLVAVAVVALVLGSFGTAVAGPAITKNKVKSIATKIVNKKAPTLSVAHAVTADTATNATNATTATTATNLAAPEAFRLVGAAGQPAFTNSWANFGGGRTTAGFYLDKESVVHLKGSIGGGASGTSAFTLPVGYRPGADLLVVLGTGSNILSNALISPTGTISVFCNGACAGSVGLDSVTFRVGAGGTKGDRAPAHTGLTPDSN